MKKFSFSCGDKVVCIEENGKMLEEAKIYTVKSFTLNRRFVILREIPHSKWFLRRFIPLTKAVLILYGVPSEASTTN